MGPKLQVTFDCADPDRLVPFWALALGYELEPPPDGHPDWISYWRASGVPEEELTGGGSGCDSIIDPDGVGPRIWFQIVPEGKTAKNRMHLDLSVSGGRGVAKAVRKERIEAKVGDLVAAGATRLRTLELPDPNSTYYGVTMHDPEGNEFCIN